ncbi:MAG: DUF1501 domain-containing protein [Planctomycetia bacterium]|nr:DUF1501 domain-containing protein [Planctomycetia bacterium]
MITVGIGDARSRLCNGLSRRHLLRMGGTSLLSSLALPRLLELQAAAESPARAKACIFLFLEGGPPHQDMWDPKPEAPAEIRGPFSPIPTSVAGTTFTEHCRECAKIAHKFTVVRSHSHADNGHMTGYYYVMTGRRAPFADGEHPIPTNEHFPSLGSIVAREKGAAGKLPPYINMPHPMSAGGPGFYGAEYAPFVIEADPSQPDFEVKDLSQLEGLSADRFALRRKMLAGLERERQRSGRAAAMSTYYGKAYELISSPEARRAFRIQDEDAKLRESYGMTQVGQCALLARRLVESGCPFVGIDAPGWDVHFNCFPSLKDDLIPPADRAFAALVNDLEARGLLENTLVIMMGEMGRTPRVNAQAGRDHWSMAQSILFAGGGTKPGQIIGATDAQAAAPTRDPVSVNDFLHTVHTLLGIDSAREYDDPLGRPVPLTDGGKLIPGLIA